MTATGSRLRQWWNNLPASVRWGVTLFVAARLFWWVWGGWVMTVLPQPPPPLPWTQPAVPPLTGLSGWLLEPWNRWDAIWYVRIAVQGYDIPDGRGAFGPLLPSLMSALGGALGGHYLIAAYIVANLACLGSLVLLYEIAQRDGHDGRRTLLMLLAYPFAFFLFVPYTESLLLCLSLAAFLSARTGRWWLAGLCGALAIWTKISALVLLLPLAWELWTRRRDRSLWNVLWLALLPAAALGWALLRQAAFTPPDPDAASPYGLLTPLLSPDLRAGWQTTLSWPWDSLLAAVLAPVRLWPYIEAIIAAIDLLVAVSLACLTLLTFRLARTSYALYTAAVFMLDLVLIIPATPLINAPRHWMTAFPLFIAAAAFIPRRLERPLIVLACVTQVSLTVRFIKWTMVG